MSVHAVQLQAADPVDSSVDRESLVRATRIMQKIDRDGNGTFEKSENETAWKRYRTLDANRDKVISLEELRRERIAYLETGRERKLNLV